MVRSLVVKKFAAALRPKDAQKDADKLAPGHMRLFSFYKPSLPAGLYGIEVTQNVNTSDNSQTKEIQNTFKGTTNIRPQRFSVVAPQFSLDPQLINTFYPPAGHQDEAHILPHIVFNDPHVPWFRPAGTQPWMFNAVDTDGTGTSTTPSDKGQNYVPWLALMVFKHDDLLIDAAEATALALDKIILLGNKSYDESKQPSDGAYPMTIADYLNLHSRVHYEASSEFADLQSSTDPTSVIFPLKTQVQTALGSSADTTSIQAQKMLAHVRQINTIGFPDAGVEEEGYYSVVVSSMTGDVTESAPTTHIVHLVSIENLDTTDLSASNTKRVGLVSLFSWTYACIPDAVNFEETMASLAADKQPLKPPSQTLDALKSSPKLFNRLDSGYTISRWRAPTGEESIAFNRGPLVPVVAPDRPVTKDGLPKWPGFSMTGKDYTILDRSLGMVDASYSAAWSMGKLMAISDSVFNAALMRLRSRIWSAATSDIRMDGNNIPKVQTALAAFVKSVGNAGSLASGEFKGPVSRINQPAAQHLAPSVDHPDSKEALANAINGAIQKAASTTTSLYNGLDGSGAGNSDFEIVANWVFDCFYLGHMPAHMIFPEPAHLMSKNPQPVKKGQTTFIPEVLRFFYIDHAWIDCFIDGALSCANHHEPEYDTTRLAIKQIINKVLMTPVGNTNLVPPVPRFGFVLRSAVVKSTPDLRLTAHCRKLGKNQNGETVWVEDEDRDPLVRHTRLDDFTILSLLDCAPEEVYSIVLAQPPHQQRFALNLHDDHTPDFLLKKLYTNTTLAPPFVEPLADGTTPAVDPTRALEWPELPWSVDQSGFYDKSTRCFKPMPVAKAMNDTLLSWGTKSNGDVYYSNPTPNSVILGLELNDPSYQLEIQMTPLPLDYVFQPWVRRIWDGGVAPPVPAPRPTPHPTQPPDKIVPIKLPAPTSTPVAPSASRITAPPIRAQIPATQPFTVTDPFSFNTAPAMQSQYELLIHPSYRPAPPRPRLASPLSKSVYSPLDYIPTDTQSRYNLVFGIRRRPTASGTPPKLRTIYIEIPLADPKAKGEPLLAAVQPGDTGVTGVRMVQNQRFVPALFSGNASSSRIPQWDGTPVLVIALTPRSSSGRIELVKGPRTADASVSLGDAAIAKIKTKEVALMQAQDRGTKGRSVGRAMVKMTEVYDDGWKFSWASALKVEGGDTDPWGRAM